MVRAMESESLYRAPAHALFLTTALLGHACGTTPPAHLEAPPATSASPGRAPEASRDARDPRTPTGPYHQLVLIWLRDAPTFRSYQEQVQAIAARYGALDQMFAPQSLYPEGLSKPDILNLVHYNGYADVSALQADPDFQRVLPMRTASIDMASVSGWSEWADERPNANTERLYLIEIARLGAGGRAAYDRYNARAREAMAAYGYHVERRLRADQAAGLPFEPDVVQIAYFDDPAGMDAFHRDPAHAELERSYGEVVAESVWILGAVHPDSPRRHE